MSLEKYRRRRRFDRTAEPAGAARKSRTGRLFVVQMHNARRMHYDFRLELGGALKSWAVPKGPSLDPYEKRLAVHVEDHPIEYGGFEGAIPEGEYGAGTVVLWDRGEWFPVEDPRKNAEEGYRAGKLKFRLEGEKLRGGWTLVRMRTAGEKGDNWLLIKERDEHARSLAEYDVLEERPESVMSGKSLSQIAAAPGRTWSKSKAKPAVPKAPKRTTRKVSIKGATRGSLPKTVKPQLATLADAAPEGDRWLHEIKLDGYRLLCRFDKGNVSLITRNALDWTARFPELAAMATELPVRRALLDGEVVALLPGGASSFQALQEALSARQTGGLVYYAFDLLHLDGHDLTKAALEDRKKLLTEVLAEADAPRIQYLDHLEGSGPEFLRQCCQMGLEGAVSKLRRGRYRFGRSDDWLKIKCVQKEEFVIGGYTRPRDTRKGLGALLVGYYNRGGDLIYAGRVGTGFSEQMLLDLRRRLASLEQPQPPFNVLPEKKLDRSIRWVRPELVAQVEFSNWTGDRLLRHPSFQGLREDVAPAAIVHEPEREPLKPSSGKPRASNNKRRAAGADEPRAARAPLSEEQREQVRQVPFTNPDRVLYPEMGLTKLGLATYYVEIAPWILPHVVDRPMSLLRCPEGHTQKCFFQKHAAAGTPEALGRVTIAEKEAKREYLVIRDLAGLLSVVQMGVLELHPWGSRTDRLEQPDRMIFDLDPDPDLPWRTVVEAAGDVHRFLADELGLIVFLKTTGGKGLHLVTPLSRRQTWEEVKAFSQAVAKHLAGAEPRRFVAAASKQARKGRIYLDYLRNSRGATAIAPYSPRARAGAPVAAPLAWDELSPAIGADHFRVDNLPGRLAALREDPWAEINNVRQSITAKMRKKVGLG